MGAWGGGYRRDGIDGVANPAANIGNAPIEMIETQAPIRVEKYELVTDSGGAGSWRGGMSVVRRLRFLGERATFQLRSDRRFHRPDGLFGGRPGAASNTMLEGRSGWEQLPTKFTGRLLAGQAFEHTTAGAGGYGDPLERDPAAVLRDVRNGKVSIAAAAAEYGVRVASSPWQVEEPATAALRAVLRQRRNLSQAVAVQ
jgi:N-methylhydantoinase B